jgi:hypothetical protein
MTALLPTPSVTVSWGELLDKVTILAIKSERIADEAALRNIAHEQQALSAVAEQALQQPGVAELVEQLRAVNEALWDVEDAIRERDAAGDFGDDFVALARQVYRRNDERAAIKRRINDQLGSAIVEEKSYAAFASDAR